MTFDKRDSPLDTRDSSSANHEVFNLANTNAHMHWYYHWRTSSGSFPLQQRPLNVDTPSPWTCSLDWSHNASDSTLSTMPYAFDIQHPPRQAWADYQYVVSRSGPFPRSQVASNVTSRVTPDQNTARCKPIPSFGSANCAIAANKIRSDRQTGRYVDTKVWASIQGDTGSQSRFAGPENTGPTVTATAEDDPQAAKQNNSPSNTEFSTFVVHSKRPRSESRHVVRRVLRCWEHGCDGRSFSSISNLRRHQRERAGRVSVSYCPRCGATFYRRWTRDHHLDRDSCLRMPRL